MKKVFVGLSGGVDSAVAAHLLKKEGYEVVGAFIKGWEPDFLPCTGAEDRLSAMRVAAHLEIPFVTYDLSDEYKKLVVDPFVAEYARGHTPNPDVLCNRTIKFGAFWQRAQADGADYIATGHYAQNKLIASSFQLLASEDTGKDQTYFLWTLTQEDLGHILFPIGKYKKTEVRKVAEKIKLPNAMRKDSQGLCFLGHVDMQEFLKRFLTTKPGMIYHTDGTKNGEHEGAALYTLGQHVSVGGGKRLYVVGKDFAKNELTVSEVRHPMSNYGHLTSIQLMNSSWVQGEAPKGVVLAQYRYHGPLIKAELKGSELNLAESILVAPGQSMVLYSIDGSICMGGGMIG